MNSKILDYVKIGDYYHVLKLQKPEGYTYQAGQFAKFTLPDTLTDKNFRVFSIASTPEEDHILIATKALPENTSEYKRTLFAKSVGDAIDIGKAMGHFTVRDSSPMVLYASGIGVTPIRSLIQSCHKNANQDIKIVYASYDNYIFEKEFEDIVKEHKNIEFFRTKEIDETMALLRGFAKQYGNSAYYYISGSPFVVKAVRDAYTEEGVDTSRMIDDVFVGYSD